jgi:hypothetical protein
MKYLTDTLASTQRGDQPARICPHCGDEQMRRLARRGFLQTRIYPLLGLYPWECVACRTIKMFRKRGKPAFRRIWDE